MSSGVLVAVQPSEFSFITFTNAHFQRLRYILYKMTADWLIKSNIDVSDKKENSLFTALVGASIEGSRRYNVFKALEVQGLFDLPTHKARPFSFCISLMCGVFESELEKRQIGIYKTKQEYDCAVLAATKHLLSCIPISRSLQNAIDSVTWWIDDNQDDRDDEIEYGELSADMEERCAALFDEINKTEQVHRLLHYYSQQPDLGAMNLARI